MGYSATDVKVTFIRVGKGTDWTDKGRMMKVRFLDRWGRKYSTSRVGAGGGHMAG